MNSNTACMDLATEQNGTSRFTVSQGGSVCTYDGALVLQMAMLLGCSMTHGCMSCIIEYSCQMILNWDLGVASRVTLISACPVDVEVSD